MSICVVFVSVLSRLGYFVSGVVLYKDTGIVASGLKIILPFVFMGYVSYIICA